MRNRSLRDRAVETYRAWKQRRPSSHEVARVYRNQSGTFAVASDDTLIGYTLGKGRVWSSDFLDRLVQIVKPEDRVLVVGGHVGTIAIPLSKHVSEMTVVEANPQTFPLLAANVALNAASNITLVNIAAGERAGSIEFLASRRNSGGAKRKPFIEDDRYLFDQPQVIRVPVARLDDMLEPRFTVIVMDIEGSEIFALQGMQNILRAAEQLVVEFCPHHLQNIGGTTMPEFYATIGSDFDQLFVPEEDDHKAGPEILPAIQSLFDRNIGCDGIVFTKSGQTNALPESSCVSPSRTEYVPLAMANSR